MKKVAILTQPLKDNYGGLLQAFALQKILLIHGYDAITVDFFGNEKKSFWGIKSILINIILKYILRRNIRSVFPMTDKERSSIGRETRRFTAQNIRTTQRLTYIHELTYLNSYKFDAYIVGSDQVWRPSYSPGLSAFFLDFLGNNKKIKRIAYAASFGTDNCNEYTKDELLNFSQLAQKFDAISVREDSGVKICQEQFSVVATHVLDPTLLLDKEDYIELVNKDEVMTSDGNMMVYVLDRSPEKQEIINEIAKVRSLTAFTVTLSGNTTTYPSVTKWLKGFIDAEYVVTDSFHGTVFALIFNKPFIVVGNQQRGVARFRSLLKKFELENRLVFSRKDLTVELINEYIDFDEINKLRIKERKSSLKFLFDALGN
ncbi:polysaccharide pyruvyl transferase family protein [Photobacterium phosphoreum]|uniref:polysaccharide pyruvyl transferase family protein n=1 Tax=Photobacterium phosphoreum TaxID=659 RepID=UPI000D18281A|nr:polysaccharide pyruvyl transferase family protein [Photobacterium phosphoreum]PSU32578.1 polysaccharide pyruvyl transferase family protein [Photobacterium phosphoreum]